MFEQDYLMRLLAEFMDAMRRSMDRAAGQHDLVGAAHGLEAAVGGATDLDGPTLLSLSPESVASILQVSGTDPKLAGFMARSLLLASHYYKEAGEEAASDLRAAQAHAIADAFGHELDDDSVTDAALEELFRASGLEDWI